MCIRDSFGKEEIRNQVIENFGKEKYDNMMDHLDDPDKIALTHDTILPSFIENALDSIYSQTAVLV